jgi:hypothetical protein
MSIWADGSFNKGVGSLTVFSILFAKRRCEDGTGGGKVYPAAFTRGSLFDCSLFWQVSTSHCLLEFLSVEAFNLHAEAWTKGGVSGVSLEGSDSWRGESSFSSLKFEYLFKWEFTTILLRGSTPSHLIFYTGEVGEECGFQVISYYGNAPRLLSDGITRKIVAKEYCTELCLQTNYCWRGWACGGDLLLRGTWSSASRILGPSLQAWLILEQIPSAALHHAWGGRGTVFFCWHRPVWSSAACQELKLWRKYSATSGYNVPAKHRFLGCSQ